MLTISKALSLTHCNVKLKEAKAKFAGFKIAVDSCLRYVAIVRAAFE